MTRVVNCNKAEYDVYIGRIPTYGNTKWGNPFKIGVDGTRAEVIRKYEEWILQQPQLMASLCELQGKVLGCHCKPEKCHGDVLIKLINSSKLMEW